MRNFVILALVTLSGCASLSEKGQKVRVVSRVDEKCKNLGPVSETSALHELHSPAERQFVLRNNVAEAGGNSLILSGDESGIAYDCATDSKAN